MTEQARTNKKRRKGRAGRFWHTASVPVLLTAAVLVIILGLVLPSVLMARQKRRLASVSMRTDLGGDVSLAQTASFESAALEPVRLSRLINARYETGNVAVHEVLEGEMTEAVAIAQAVKEVSRMTELSLIPSYCADLEGAQYTALLSTYHYNSSAERDYDPAYDFWDISFYKSDLTVHLQLDVLSGKILSFEARIYNGNLARLWEIENSDMLEAYGYAEDVAYEYDAELEAMEREAYGYPVRIETVEMTAVMRDGTMRDMSQLPEGFDARDIAELTITLIDEKGVELERVTLTEELSLLWFYDDFDRLDTLTTYMKDYLGLAQYIEHIEVDAYADIDRAYYDLNEFFIEAELASYWDEANWYISYRLY